MSVSNKLYNQKQISYFQGLNALRFFAAMFVVLHHAEQIRMKYGLFHLKEFSLFNNGGIAVTFFFVLSGFLITHLLLKEQNNTHKISIKNFYVRRVLRIWPLYYLLVIIGTLIVPFAIQTIGYEYEMPYTISDVAWYYIFFLPFMVNIIYGHNLLEPLWSIGVEEIFYLGWAPLIKFLRNKVFTLLITVICIKLIFDITVYKFELSGIIFQALGMLQFHAMAIGGLAAYFIFNNKLNVSKTHLFSLPVQIIIFVFIFIRLCFANFLANYNFFKFLFNTPIFSNFLLILVFAWLILNTSLNSKSIIKLNGNFLNFGGEISYGIYMYHMLVVFSIVLIFKNFFNSINSTVATTIFYILLLGNVIGVSYLSKRFFENCFLKLKSKFEN